jgi:hypothetical protein
MSDVPNPFLEERQFSPFDLVMACVDAMSRDDTVTLAQLDPELSRLGTDDILNSLLAFGELLSRGVKSDQRDQIRKTLADSVGDGSPESSAIVDLCTALLADADRSSCQVAWETHKDVWHEDPEGIVYGCLAGTAAVVDELDIKLNFG